MKRIFTIGYSTFNIDDFISCLKKHNISCVVDVRSNPFSEFFQDYNKDVLERSLQKYNILYRNYKKEFGARQEDFSFYPEGYLDFSLFTKSPVFIEGLEKIEKGVAKGYVFVLMCAEKDPIGCHRNIMVAKAFKENGYEINHIHSDCQIETQAELEIRMLDQYFPDRKQIKLFEESQSEIELIETSYKLKNKEIGYQILLGC